MKDLTKIIQKGNLTPRERALLVIKHDAHLIKTGETLLSEADLVVLTTSWKPQSNYEADQYNKLISLWDTYQKLQVDMQTCYLTTQIALLRFEHIASMFYYRKDNPKENFNLENLISEEDLPEFRTFFLEHSGYEYDRLVHLYTFHSLPENIQQDILLIDPNVTTDHSYFLDEERITRILGNKKVLTDEDADMLTKTIIDSVPWGHELELLKTKISVKKVIFNMHFAGYPLMNFGKRLASRHNIQYDTEDELRDKLSRLDDLKYKLEKVVRDAISDGSFFEEYTPLCKSNDHLTYEEETILPHDELMKLWLKMKDSVIKTIQLHLDNGELEVCECPTRFFEVNINKTYITGTGLEQENVTPPFTKDFLGQINRAMLYSYPAFLVHKSSVFQNYQYLLEYQNVTARLSELVGVDLSENATSHLESISESVSTLNFYLRQISDHVLEKGMGEIKYQLQTFVPEPIITIQNIAPSQNKSLKVFTEKLNRLNG
jgi:hypothetical protein